jgi:tetratricopeptide (TPR) repeat protein
MGDNERALAELDRTEQIEPEHPLIKIFRARILFYHGEVQEAVAQMRDVLAKNPHLEGMRPILGILLASQGERDEAREQLTPRALQMAEADFDMAYWTASTYSLLGEKDEAIRWLEQAINLGNENREWFDRDRNWDSLRDDARFIELMRRIEENAQTEKA